MKILFIAMPQSIHTARWISQLKDSEWDVHFCASTSDYKIHDKLDGITYHYLKFELPVEKPKNKYIGHFLKFIPHIKRKTLAKIVRNFTELLGWTQSRLEMVEQVIKKIKPDIIHTLETQSAAYLINSIKKKNPDNFPVWIHSNWGIDLHFFGKLHDHANRIKDTLSAIDVLIVEGKRDELLAKQFDYNGPVYTYSCGGGGFLIPDQTLVPAQQRNLILIKGTQDECRRGLVAIRGLERCVELLGDYQLMLYTSNDVTRIAAELFEYNTGKEIKIVPEVSHEEMLALNSRAVLTICVNLSDGLPNAMLEGMLMGAFPIQSNTSLAEEWIEDGKNGMLVPPEDPELDEQAIRKALSMKDQFDTIAKYNRKLISDKLEYTQVKAEVIKFYSSILVKSVTND